MAGKRNVRFAKSESARKAITKQQLKEINKLYKDVYKQMEQKQKDLANKTTYSSGIQRLYLDQFKKDMQAEMSRINAQVKNILEDGAVKVAEAVVEENNEILKSMGLFVNGAFSYVPTNAVRQIINGNVYNGQWTLSKALWGSNQKNIKSIENIVAAGLAGNKSIKEISKDLMSYSKSGNAKYNATRLARTMSNHAYQKAYQMTTEKNPFVEAYQWNNGTANTCPLCIDLATQDRFGLGNGVFPKNEVPLDHPNGFCYITSIMSSRDDVDKALIDWINGTGDVGMNQQLDEFARDMGFMPQVVKNAVQNSPKTSAAQFGTDKWYNTNFKKITKEMTQEQKDELVKGLKNGTDGWQKAFAKVSKSTKFKGFVNEKTGAFYSPANKFVNIDLAAIQKQAESSGIENKMHTLFHEMGHAIDDYGTYKYSQSVKFTKAFKDDVKKIFADYKKDDGMMFSYKFGQLKLDDNSRGIQDIFSGLNNAEKIGNAKNPFYEEKVRTNWSHSNDYWTRRDVEKEMKSELFAHLSAAQASPTQRKMMEQWFPNSLSTFEEMLK